MLHASKQVNGRILWANMHLLFWLSLTPFASGWMGENHFAKWPVIVYGCLLLMCAIAYTILSKLLTKLHGKDSALATAIGSDTKGKVSILLYVLGIGTSFIHPWFGFSFYVVVAAIWIIPDRRIEKNIAEKDTDS
jgi:uncharacterized membrane protein